MIMLLSLILFVIVTGFAGLNIIMLFDTKNAFNWQERLGLSYLFGIGAISLEMFIMGLLKFEFVTTCILTPWALVFLINILRYHRMGRLKARNKDVVGLNGTVPPKGGTVHFRTDNVFSRFEKILVFLLSFQVIYTFFRALSKPIEAYDSVSIWALKAKILYLAKTIPAGFFDTINASFHGIHADYPLLLPFSEVWFYTFLGNLNDYLVKVIFPLNFLAFLVVFYSLLRRVTKKRKTSLLFTFILASVKQFSDYATIGSADLQMGIYCFLTFIFIFMWVKYENSAYLTSSVISCIFAFWTKNEGGAVFLIALALLTASLKKSPSEPGRFGMVKEARRGIVILFIVFLAWLGFKASLHLKNDLINIGAIRSFSFSGIYKRIIPIAYEYQKHIFGFKKWNLVWIGFLYFVIVRFKTLFTAYRYITIPIGGILLAYTAVYMITPQDIHWHLSSSASRLLIHILPLVVFFIALNINNIPDGKYAGGA
jgi:hypothetical protein